MGWMSYDANGQPMVTSLSSPLSTKGDIWSFDTGNNRFPIGGNNAILVANSAATFGMSWATDQYRLRSVVTFTANGTYTTPANVRAIIVRAVGGGGAGGGSNAASIANVSVSGGGSAGAYGEKLILTPNTTYAIVVGLGGIGAASVTGPAGSNTTFGATVLVCQGGPGGIGAQQNAITIAIVAGGANAPVATGGDINLGGEAGENGLRTTLNTTFAGGRGGTSPFGTGGQGKVNLDGVGSPALGFGGGGGGACSNTVTARAGGNGANGIVHIYEFC